MEPGPPSESHREFERPITGATGASAGAHSQFATALGVCADALSSLAQDASPESMRDPIVTLAAMARRSGIPPEEFLTDLKTLLRDAPPIKGTDPLEREGVAHRLVTLAIEAYYAERAD